MIVLDDGVSRVTIAARGAELLSWRAAVGGVAFDVLWQRDAAWWDGTAPILFPIVGWANGGVVRIEGRTFPMDVHGFARSTPFKAVETSPSHAFFVLDGSPELNAGYPFPFRLTVTYVLSSNGDAASLGVTMQVTNTGERTMPYAIGLHPGFAWPLGDAARDAHVVDLGPETPAMVPVIARGGLFSQAMRPVPVMDGRLALSDDLFAHEALCFLDLDSKHITLQAGDRALSIQQDGLPHLALWSKPGAPFICLESWSGYGDPVGYDGELADKPSMRLLPTGKTSTHGATYTVSRTGHTA